jgi:hypothetical protein
VKPKHDNKVRRPNGRWIPSAETDITVTWDRARKKLEQERKEREEKVHQIKNMRFAK